ATSRLLEIANSTAQREEAWASEITVGPLALTDVPVHQAATAESDITGIKNYVGTLGMYALERVDLVVDGKSGFAYLHLRPGPGPAYPGIVRPGVKPDVIRNWAMANNVSLKFDSELVFAADRKLAGRDVQGCIHDCTQAIAINPQNARAYFTRGSARASTTDTDAALADLSAAINLDPTAPAAYFNRGAINARKGDWQNSIPDFDRAIQLNPNNATAYFTRGLAHQMLGDFSAAAADYQKSVDLKPSDHSRLLRD